MNVTDDHHPDPRIEDVRMVRLDGKQIGYHWEYPTGSLQVALIVRASDAEKQKVESTLEEITGLKVAKISQPPKPQPTVENEPSHIITSLDEW